MRGEDVDVEGREKLLKRLLAAEDADGFVVSSPLVERVFVQVVFPEALDGHRLGAKTAFDKA